MSARSEKAALVLLMRGGRRSAREYPGLLTEAGSAIAVLNEERGLLADLDLARGEAEVARWEARGIRLLSVLDPAYPANLGRLKDRPALLFVAGKLRVEDRRSIAVIGSREASFRGLARAREIAGHLAHNGVTVVSGLATGIDTEAHLATLSARGRTVAVLGTGIERTYPPGNAALQRRIAQTGALISQFWPDCGPSRRSFPLRNAVMAGVSLGTVVVEATAVSGARLQARLAGGQGRPVFLVRELLRQAWARELSGRPGVHVIDSPQQIIDAVQALRASAVAPG